MKKKTVLLLGGLLLLVTSCKQQKTEQEGILSIGTGWSNSRKELIQDKEEGKDRTFAQQDQLEKNNVDLKLRLPKLSGSIDAVNYTKDLWDRVDSKLNELLADSESNPAGKEYDVDYSYYANEDLNLLSVLIQSYYFNGGANGVNTLEATVFNRQSGDKMDWNDLFTDEAMSYLVTDINRQIARATEQATDEIPSLYYEDTVLQDLSQAVWYFQSTGLTLTFQQYALGPRSSGTISFSYPLQDLKDYHLLKTVSQ